MVGIFSPCDTKISLREICKESSEGKKSGAFSRDKTAHERNTNTIEVLQKKTRTRKVSVVEYNQYLNENGSESNRHGIAFDGS